MDNELEKYLLLCSQEVVSPGVTSDSNIALTAILPAENIRRLKSLLATGIPNGNIKDSETCPCPHTADCSAQRRLETVTETAKELLMQLQNLAEKISTFQLKLQHSYRMAQKMATERESLKDKIKEQLYTISRLNVNLNSHLAQDKVTPEVAEAPLVAFSPPPSRLRKATNESVLERELESASATIDSARKENSLLLAENIQLKSNLSEHKRSMHQTSKMLHESEERELILQTEITELREKCRRTRVQEPRESDIQRTVTKNDETSDTAVENTPNAQEIRKVIEGLLHQNQEMESQISLLKNELKLVNVDKNYSSGPLLSVNALEEQGAATDGGGFPLSSPNISPVECESVAVQLQRVSEQEVQQMCERVSELRGQIEAADPVRLGRSMRRAFDIDDLCVISNSILRSMPRKWRGMNENSETENFENLPSREFSPDSPINVPFHGPVGVVLCDCLDDIVHLRVTLNDVTLAYIERTTEKAQSHLNVMDNQVTAQGHNVDSTGHPSSSRVPTSTWIGALRKLWIGRQPTSRPTQ